LNRHFAVGEIAEPELVIVHQRDSQVYGFLLEIHNESIAVETAVVICVHLDSRFTIHAQVDYAVLFEYVGDFLGSGVTRNVGDVDCTVLRYLLLYLLLFGGLGL
jgi:hypothetical protein